MESSAPEKLRASEFARQIHDQLVPLGSRFSYFFTGIPFGEEDVKEYLEDPIQALSPALRKLLPKVAIVLVPYIERGAPGDKPLEDLISFERPDRKRQIWASTVSTEEGPVLLFGLHDHDVGEYHYLLYRSLAAVAADILPAEAREQFAGILRDELTAGVHGEVDEESWEAKQALIRRRRNVRRKTKGFTKYARQALSDTLTLYLHGICCDIDIETGPRQLASRHLRRRLELLQSLYPPPEGYAVFPEDLNHAGKRAK